MFMVHTFDWKPQSKPMMIIMVMMTMMIDGHDYYDGIGHRYSIRIKNEGIEFYE